MIRYALISAAVSNEGPQVPTYTPECTWMSHSLADFKSSSRSSLSYASYNEGKRGPMGSFGPIRGFAPEKFMWSVSATSAPGPISICSEPAAFVMNIFVAPRSLHVYTGTTIDRGLPS
eukprot:3525349-Rhodomonas_salina.1